MNTWLLGVPITFPPTLTPAGRQRVARLLEQSYPRGLRDAGLEGGLILMVFMDAQGRIPETRLVRSSGYSEMDVAASTVARGAGPFLPALAGECSVPYVFRLPIQYRLADPLR
jgi:TonB family protein